MDVLTKKRLFDMMAESEKEYRMILEQQRLNQLPTPTPSITPSITSTCSPTPTPSITPTYTSSPTPTPSCTPPPVGIINITKVKLRNLPHPLNKLFGFLMRVISYFEKYFRKK